MDLPRSQWTACWREGGGQDVCRRDVLGRRCQETLLSWLLNPFHWWQEVQYEADVTGLIISPGFVLNANEDAVFKPFCFLVD